MQEDYGLKVTEVDILLGGKAHDLMDKDAQNDWIQQVEAGNINMSLLGPPCGSWSRANWANNKGPKPCRNRRHPWGIPHLKRHQQRRAAAGNEFVHFSIRVIRAAAAAKLKGFFARSFLEHPEDLGRCHSGEPASIWQVEDVRTAHGNPDFTTVA